MKSKARLLVKASITAAIVLAFILPVSAVERAPVAVNPQGIAPLKGGEWIEQATHFPDPSRGIGYVCAVDENVVWAAAYDGLAPSAECQDFAKTVDGGETWVPDVMDAAGGIGLRFSMIYALDANTAWAPLFYSSDGIQGIYKTTDGGSTWARQTTAVFDVALGAFPNCVHFWDASVGWCMGDPVDGYYEIYTTTDGGTTWTRVPKVNIPDPLSGEFGVIGYYDVVGDTIWFGTNMGRVYKSIDRGTTWTVAQTTLDAYIKPVFKDANNGLVIDLNSAGIAYLAETSDGGATWQDVTYTGMCYDNDLCYVPGTDNMYVSTGAATGLSGASYSLDGGHSWIEYDAMYDIQMMALDFVEGQIGWAGGFNDDETTGGMFKHIPGADEPALTISIAGGTGVSVTVKNVGTAPATNVTYDVSITGGLFVKPRDMSGSVAALGIGNETSETFAVMGFGLGIILPMPEITVTASCAEGASASASASAKIMLSKVTLV